MIILIMIDMVEMKCMLYWLAIIGRITMEPVLKSRGILVSKKVEILDEEFFSC